MLGSIFVRSSRTRAGAAKMSLYVILMGVQGAGKGLHAKRIEARYGIPQVSTGDLFRAMRTRSDALARKVQDLMAAGILIDDDTTNAIVADRLAQPDARAGVILDGYPRNKAQAAFLEERLAQKGAGLSAVLLLELDLFTAFKRAFGRVTAGDGASYNYYFKSGGVNFEWQPDKNEFFAPRLVAKLQETGESLKRRPDDASADAIIKRIDTFLETTQPLIDYFAAKDLVRKINADQSIEAVWAEIERALDQA